MLKSNWISVSNILFNIFKTLEYILNMITWLVALYNSVYSRTSYEFEHLCVCSKNNSKLWLPLLGNADTSWPGCHAIGPKAVIEMGWISGTRLNLVPTSAHHDFQGRLLFPKSIHLLAKVHHVDLFLHHKPQDDDVTQSVSDSELALALLSADTN